MQLPHYVARSFRSAAYLELIWLWCSAKKQGKALSCSGGSTEEYLQPRVMWAVCRVSLRGFVSTISTVEFA